jgi:glutaredoxin 3
MPKITIYTKPYCPYCMRALQVLEDKGAEFTEIEAASDVNVRREMIQKAGRSTYPQIFIGDRHIGGCDDILALERSGELDRLLAA